jgi:1-acyl-sn-glycerol-3-phosphate acyltransferase
VRAVRVILRPLYAVWYYVFFLTLTLLSGILCLFLSLISQKASRVATGQIWGSAVLGPAFIDLEVRGKENLPREGGFVVFINHRSLLDIPAAALATELPLTWLAKAQLGKIPLFGWCLKRGHMLIEREGGAEAAKRMVEDASRRLKNREIIAIFPEGTRNRGDAPLLPFKKGAFILAKHTGATLVPLATYGTGKLWPAGGILPRPGTIKVLVGKPLRFGPRDSLNTVTQKAYEALHRLYAELSGGEEGRPEGDNQEDRKTESGLRRYEYK